jgi:myo-inositol-1(or 4)-monophosphatase
MVNLHEMMGLALEVAGKAGRIQKDHLGKLKGYKLKGVANLVTEVDLACEEAVIGLIRERHPDHGFLAEERGAESAEAENVWIIDPLDGTTNYAHGYLRFCVSIALEVKGVVELGVVYDPVMKETYRAIRGQGSFLNDTRLEVSAVERLEDALLGTGFSYDRGARLGRSLKIFEKIIPEVQSIRRDGCAALNLCYVAAGRYDGFWELNLNPWDIAAGKLIIEEAGGRVTDLVGKASPLDKQEIWASNGKIHHELIGLVKGLA